VTSPSHAAVFEMLFLGEDTIRSARTSLSLFLIRAILLTIVWVCQASGLMDTTFALIIAQKRGVNG
jgi:hypothetical protein